MLKSAFTSTELILNYFINWFKDNSLFHSSVFLLLLLFNIIYIFFFLNASRKFSLPDYFFHKPQTLNKHHLLQYHFVFVLKLKNKKYKQTKIKILQN